MGDYNRSLTDHKHSLEIRRKMTRVIVQWYIAINPASWNISITRQTCGGFTQIVVGNYMNNELQRELWRSVNVQRTESCRTGGGTGAGKEWERKSERERWIIKEGEPQQRYYTVLVNVGTLKASESILEVAAAAAVNQDFILIWKWKEEFTNSSEFRKVVIPTILTNNARDQDLIARSTCMELYYIQMRLTRRWSHITNLMMTWFVCLTLCIEVQPTRWWDRGDGVQSRTWAPPIFTKQGSSPVKHSVWTTVLSSWIVRQGDWSLMFLPARST